MKMTRKEKKNKDTFSVSIIGVVIYSVILMAVMGGSYIGVRALLKNQDARDAIAAAEEVAEPTEEVVEEAETEEPIEEPIEEEPIEAEDVYTEHEAKIADIIDQDTGYVSYSNILFEPAKRDDTLKWNDTVFSKIEDVKNPANSLVNTFRIKSVGATLDSLKLVEYRAYTNPDNGYIEKITEVVDCEGPHQVIDYYYDQGNINYIAQYNMTAEIPVPLSSADIESRYYYKNDVLVRYIYCGDGKAIEYTVDDLKNYSNGTVEQYDFLEKDMINRAYIVYNLAESLVETETVYGYVMDEYQVPLEDAEVRIVSDKDGSIQASGQTDGDGYYKLSLKCDETDTYTVKIDKDGLTGVNVYGVTSYPGADRYSVSPVYLGYEGNGEVFNEQVIVRDALDSSKALSGANIKIRRGINDKDGEVIVVGTLDEVGSALIPMAPGSYTAEVSKGGYETTYFPVIVRVDHLAVVGYSVPDVPADTIRAVLSWESSPLDLDFMVISSQQGRVIKSSIDSLGVTTAEVIEIGDVGQDSYRFYVSDHGSITTKDAYSYNLTKSNAIVSIFTSDGLVSCTHVPVASAGVIWEPLQIFNDRILPMNNYYYNVETAPIWTQK